LTDRIFLIIALFLLIGLIGCSSSSEDNSNIPSGIIPASDSEDVIITFSSDDSIRSVIEPLIETFHEEFPSITVQYVPLSADDYDASTTIEDRLLMLARSADTTLTSIRSAYAGSYFLDLQPLIDSDASFGPSDFWPGIISGMEDTEGRITGLPITLFLQGIFYNKSAFAAANLPYPQPGWTWDDFRSAAAALSEDDRYGYADRAIVSILRPLVGYDLMLNDAEINAEALTAELEWYVKMTQEDQILSMRSTDDLLLSQFNTDSPPAMWSGSLFELTLGGVTGEPEATDLPTFFSDSTYGFAPYPVDADGENVNTSPVTALYGAISIGSEHPLESWKWLNFLSAHWLVSSPGLALNQLHIPVRQSVAEAAGFWDNYPPEVRDAMQYGLAHAWFASLYSRAETAVLNDVQKVAVVNSSLMSALEDTEAKQASWSQDIPDVPDITIVPPEPPESTALGVEKIDLYYLSYNAQVDAAMAALARQFNQDHKDEIVVQTGITLPDTGERFYVQIANNYDCFLAQLAPGDAIWAASAGMIVDLTALMEGEDAAFQQDFDPLLLNAARYNEALYALPISNQPAIMVYNADLLSELGLEPPPLDWTFDEFLEMITAVSSSSESEQIYGFLPTSHLVNTTGMFFASRGVQWRDISGDFPVVMFDTQEMADAIVWWAELEQSGVIFQPASGNNWYASVVNAMDSGQIGFWTEDAGYQEWDISQNRRLPFNVGIVPLPYTKKPNGSFDKSFITGFYISNQTEFPQACWELAKYVSERGDELLGVPARISVANSAAWEARVGADNAEVYRAAIASNLSSAQVTPYDGWFWIPIEHWLWQATENITNGNNAAQELAQAQQYSDAYLACMASYDDLSLNQMETAVSCAALVDPDWE
jgi:ABC-type glycerol-3-phosphate transport system substrate-binding protein